MSRPRATLKVMGLPELGPDGRRVEVICPSMTTSYQQVQGPPSGLSDAEMTTIAATVHAGRCGRCNLDDVHSSGSRELRGRLERSRVGGRTVAPSRRAP